ncbi:cadherin-like beta sandwich domain-containing protein [Paenibacillus koleovorans]|uniref:cadherin-like beta sandwich domain-containing protein n=1 Tax=Paenibacillus koleovorans TaxID=121608 RepID=UPI0013E32B5D|nr:cadherin-like beta sandwich domain-containing protein [Paenibacillus koleovorans]
MTELWYLHIKAEDAAGNTVNAQSNRFRLDTSAAELSGLSLSAGTLSPAFAGNTDSYSARVSQDVSFITVMPVTADTSDSITLSANGDPSQTVASGTSSGQLTLREGANTISISVTALNGTQKSYTVIVNRDAQSSVTQMPAANLRHAEAVAAARAVYRLIIRCCMSRRSSHDGSRSKRPVAVPYAYLKGKGVGVSSGRARSGHRCAYLPFRPLKTSLLAPITHRMSADPVK